MLYRSQVTPYAGDAAKAMRSTKKLRRLVRDHGFRTTVLYLIDNCSKWARLPIQIHSYYIMEQPVAVLSQLKDDNNDGYSFSEIREDDNELKKLPLETKTIVFRFRQGARCFIFRSGDRPVGYIWLQQGVYEEDEVRCRFSISTNETSCWDFDVYIFPEYRRTRQFFHMWTKAAQHMEKEGITCTFSRISAFNEVSLRSHLHLDAKVIGRADFIRFGHIQVMASTFRPFLHISRGQDRIPIICVEGNYKSIPKYEGMVAKRE